MPDDTNSQGSEVEEVIVVVPEETAGASAPSGTGASTGETGTAPESGSVTEEVIEAVLDPLGVAGAGDGSGTATGAAEEVVVVEEVVLDPDATGAGTATDPTDPTDPNAPTEQGASPAAEQDPASTVEGSATGDNAPESDGGWSVSDPSADGIAGGESTDPVDGAVTGDPDDPATASIDPETTTDPDATADPSATADPADPDATATSRSSLGRIYRSGRQLPAAVGPRNAAAGRAGGEPGRGLRRLLDGECRCPAGLPTVRDRGRRRRTG